MNKSTGTLARKLKRIYKKSLLNKGHDFFDNGRPYNLNIIGVRSSNSFTNKFDDNIVVIYRDADTKWVVKTYAATTDPGKNALVEPMNKKGAAILVPGQYKSAYKLDLHRGKYIALCQRKPVKVYRDNNLDLEYDFVNPEDGLFGINIHRSSTRGDTKYINSWSHGCQVFKKTADYYDFINLCEKSADIYGNSFTYTLLLEEDL